MSRLNDFLLLEDSTILTPGRRRMVFGLLLALLSVATVMLVYVTGGTRYVFAHLAYVPLIGFAAAFGRSGGLVAAAALGLALGPWMPLDAAAGVSQPATNWIFRTGMFAVAGLLAGFLFDQVRGLLQRLRTIAFQDHESGLPNRLALEYDVRREYRAHAGNEAPGMRQMLVLCKVTNLPELVSLLDYSRAVQVFRRISARIAQEFGEAVRVYRTATDEVAMLVRVENRRDAMRSAQEARRLAEGPHNLGDFNAHVDLAAGVAALPTHAVGEPDELFRKTYVALLKSLDSECDHVNYRHGMDRSDESVRLLGEIRQAMRRGELELHYQPKLELATDRIVGAEALLRWRHPELGMVPPGRFIPALERTSLINLCTAYIFDLVLEQYRAWLRAGLDISVAVNISTRNLQHPGLLRGLRRKLARAGVDPARLELEITETALIKGREHGHTALNHLREAGFCLSIDDFGTGYSSLSYLKSLPVTQLKIDQTFIRNLAHDASDRQITQSAVAMARGLGLQTVGEGVEDGATLAWLVEAGCDLAQGFHICRPLPVDAATAFIRDWNAAREAADA